MEIALPTTTTVPKTVLKPRCNNNENFSCENKLELQVQRLEKLLKQETKSRLQVEEKLFLERKKTCELERQLDKENARVHEANARTRTLMRTLLALARPPSSSQTSL